MTDLDTLKHNYKVLQQNYTMLTNGFNKNLDLIDRLKEALEFYADRQNWLENLNERGFYMTAEAIKDDGKRAREALGRVKGEHE